MIKIINKKGQSILEVILAVAIFGLIAAAMMALVTGGFTALTQGGEQTQAEALVQEAIEGVRSIRDGAWNDLTYTTSSVGISGNQWIFSGENTTEIIGKYTRTISFENVCRNASDNIVACPGNYNDVQSKKIIVTVSWNTVKGEQNQVQQIAYLTNWDSREWTQTDWSGGSGQSIWSDTTMYNTDDGNIDDSVVEEIKLSPVTVGTCSNIIWPFTNAGDYSYNNTKLEVSGGLASLVDQGGGAGSCSGTPAVCNTFLDSGTCSGQTGCTWVASASGSTANSDFDTNLNSWTYADWGQGGGEVNVNGSRISSGGNPSGYAQITFPSGSSDELGGYFYQPFTTTIDNPTATVNFNQLVSAFSGTPITFKFYVFVDTNSSAPVIGNEVYASGEITGTSSWVSVSNLNVSSKVTTAGVYYLKIAVWLETGSSAGPFTIGYDNTLLNWSGSNSCGGTPNACNTFVAENTCTNQNACTWAAGSSYPSDSPTINPTVSGSVASVESWGSFSEVAVKNGGEIYYQLSDDDGGTWQYWDGANWSTAGAANYNTAAIVNTNIADFSTSTGQIMFKAFLQSDGNQLVQLDEVKVGYLSLSGGAGYVVFGYFISSAFNAGDIVSVQVLEWDETLPVGTDIKLQIRTAPDVGGVPGVWTSWYGATGAGTYFTEPLDSIIPAILNGNRWLQYRAELSGDAIDTPILQEVRVNYK